MALIRDAIRIDTWARAQHATHTATVRPEWCPLCQSPDPEPPSPAAPGARPRYRLTPEGVIPCPTTAPAKSATPAVHSVPPRPATASRCATPARTATTKRKSRGAGAYAGLLDRLEALGATFCPDCYGYFAPDHTEHSWHGIRGPVVPVAHCTLAAPVVVDGLDGQAELVTIQTPEEERAA